MRFVLQIAPLPLLALGAAGVLAWQHQRTKKANAAAESAE